MTDKELQAMAAQLRQPNGDAGIAIAAMMDISNKGMIRHSIDKLDIQHKDHVLELGHGNGAHLDYLLTKKEGVTYVGLEMSALMSAEAARTNKRFVDSAKASFQVYDGQNMPFEDDTFDKIFTVNTIYFWADPFALMSELYRVTKPGGRVNITFAQKHFMATLPFTKFGFELYDDERIERLVASSQFTLASSVNQQEMVATRAGDMVEREFTTACLTKV